MQMMILASLAATLVISCSSGTSTIPLGDDAKFEVNSTEVVSHPAKKADIDTYAAILNNYDSLQLPVYRHIRGASYNVFISVAIPSGMMSAVDVVKQDTSATILSVREDKSDTTILLRKGNLFTAVTFPVALKNPAFVVSMMSTNEAEVRNWFSTNGAMSRVKAD